MLGSEGDEGATENLKDRPNEIISVNGVTFELCPLTPKFQIK